MALSSELSLTPTGVPAPPPDQPRVRARRRPGRWAAAALGLGRWRTLRRIVLPQAMRTILPAAGNMLIGTLKSTSIVSVLAVVDLLYSVQIVYNRTYRVIPLLLVATLWYVVVTSVLTVGQYYLERYYARGARLRTATAADAPVHPAEEGDR